MQNNKENQKEEKSSSRLDALGTGLTSYVAARTSRRSALVKLGQGMAGLFGVAFVGSFVVDNGIRAYGQTGADNPVALLESPPPPPPPPPPPCGHDDGCGGRSKKCGLKGIDCVGFKRFDSANDCKWGEGAEGLQCPEKTGVSRAGWTACCTCNPAHTYPNGDDGEQYDYTDCCGHPSAACLVAAGLYYAFGGHCGNNLCPHTQDWCASGTRIICTLITGNGNTCKASTWNVHATTACDH